MLLSENLLALIYSTLSFCLLYYGKGEFVLVISTSMEVIKVIA